MNLLETESTNMNFNKFSLLKRTISKLVHSSLKRTVYEHNVNVINLINNKFLYLRSRFDLIKNRCFFLHPRLLYVQPYVNPSQ